VRSCPRAAIVSRLEADRTRVSGLDTPLAYPPARLAFTGTTRWTQIQRVVVAIHRYHHLGGPDQG
jgi:hypothetical protein